MRNKQVRDDVHQLLVDDAPGAAVGVAVSYIEFLEGQEDRLRKFEQALNTVEDSNLSNKADFLKYFEALKVN